MKDEEKRELQMTPAALSALVKGDIANFVAAATPGGIEAQEAQGQCDLVSSDTLPHHFGCMANDKEKANFEAIGIKFLEQIDDCVTRV